MTPMRAMYVDYFHLDEPPFSIAPNPHYLFMSAKHREALAHLVYGASGGGFVLLTGEIGTGKTTLCRCLLEQLPENCDVAVIFNPKLSAGEMLAAICDEFELVYPAAGSTGGPSIKTYVDVLNAYLLARHAEGRTAVLILDEAQNLTPDVLEQMRLLTNLETNDEKLLQIVMIGQPELRTMLERPELKQLAQRITARYHLEGLTKAESHEYVLHRLRRAGGRDSLFQRGALSLLYRLSGGVPRLINVICDRALLGAYVQGESAVTRRTVKKAAEEVFGRREERPTPTGRMVQRFATAMTVLIGGIGLAAAIYFFAPASFLETLRLEDVVAGDGVPAEADPAPLR
jgi:general secretion pathway protein A